MRNELGVTPLHLASQWAQVDEIVRLVASGADVNSTDSKGNTPLKYACAEASLTTVSKLIELGADVTIADDRGFTPLHCAAGHHYPDSLAMATLVIEHGADVNARSTALGFVPLHEASCVEMIDLLLDHGADPGILSDAGLAPLEYLIEEGMEQEAAHLAKRLGSPKRDL